MLTDVLWPSVTSVLVLVVKQISHLGLFACAGICVERSTCDLPEIKFLLQSGTEERRMCSWLNASTLFSRVVLDGKRTQTIIRVVIRLYQSLTAGRHHSCQSLHK